MRMLKRTSMLDIAQRNTTRAWMTFSDHLYSINVFVSRVRQQQGAAQATYFDENQTQQLEPSEQVRQQLQLARHVKSSTSSRVIKVLPICYTKIGDGGGRTSTREITQRNMMLTHTWNVIRPFAVSWMSIEVRGAPYSSHVWYHALWGERGAPESNEPLTQYSADRALSRNDWREGSSGEALVVYHNASEIENHKRHWLRT